MATEFKLPEVSEGVESVDIAEILVAEGDTIDAGTIICEVETDKAVAEIECPHAGTITKRGSGSDRLGLVASSESSETTIQGRSLERRACGMECFRRR